MSANISRDKLRDIVAILRNQRVCDLNFSREVVISREIYRVHCAAIVFCLHSTDFATDCDLGALLNLLLTALLSFNFVRDL